MVLEGIKKRTKYVRYMNGIGLIVHPTYVGDTFGLPIKRDGFGLIGGETKGFERIFSYERNEVIKMNKVKELDVEKVTEELVEEVKPCKHVVKKEGVEDKVEAFEGKASCVIEDARTVVVDGLKKAATKVKSADKETLVAGGFVGTILVLGLVKKLFRK